MNSKEDKQLDQDARASLLHHYSSNTLAHGGYIFAYAVALMIGINIFFRFAPSMPQFIYVGILIFVFLGLALIVGVHIAGRTLYWGLLSQHVLYLEPHQDQSTPLIHRIHKNTFHRVKHHKIVGKFETLKSVRKYYQIWIILLIFIYIAYIIAYIVAHIIVYFIFPFLGF
ncbi:MAG: hypothetical protein ACE5GD_00725 [Candidatus Geothermarchaeales archaeon]